MKICTLTSIFPRYKGDHCGAGITIYETAKNLISHHGIEMSVVAPNSYRIPKYDILDGIKVYRFSYFFPRKYQKLAYDAGIPTNLRNLKLAKIQLPLFIINFFLRAIRPVFKTDIIHIQWILNGIIGVPLGMMFHKPIVISVRRVVPSTRWMRYVIKFVAERADYILFNSSYTRDELLKFATPKKYCIIPSILNATKFQNGKPGKLRKKLGLSDDVLMVLYVGYLIEKKGVQYLIEAISKVKKNIKKVHFVIGGDGLEAESLKRQANELGVAQEVTFLGWVNHDDLPNYYCDADIFVLPSIIDSQGETETLGMVLVEAMASGLPVIGSNVGGIPDVITPEVGFLSEPKNSTDIAEKIILLLSNEKKRRTMGQAAKQWASEHFSWLSVSQKYLDIYQEVIQ